MLPDRVSNPGPLTYESGALPIALRGTAERERERGRERERVLLYLVFIPLSHCLSEQLVM